MKTGKKLSYDDFKIGYSGTFTKKITEEANRKFGELVEDFNPFYFF